MDLKEYFDTKMGFGVLSTADGEGNVDAAVYSRPYVMEDGTIASIMSDRLTHANLNTNPRAVYLFREDGQGYQGKRLYLTKIGEVEDDELIGRVCRHCYPHGAPGGQQFVVRFRVDKELPLIGSGD